MMINLATGELVTEVGPLASGEIILLDEIIRIPLKSQSAFLPVIHSALDRQSLVRIAVAGGGEYFEIHFLTMTPGVILRVA